MFPPIRSASAGNLLSLFEHSFWYLSRQSTRDSFINSHLRIDPVYLSYSIPPSSLLHREVFLLASFVVTCDICEKSVSIECASSPLPANFLICWQRKTENWLRYKLHVNRYTVHAMHVSLRWWQRHFANLHKQKCISTSALIYRNDVCQSMRLATKRWIVVTCKVHTYTCDCTATSPVFQQIKLTCLLPTRWLSIRNMAVADHCAMTTDGLTCTYYYVRRWRGFSICNE